jgi:hypothetical protein
MHSVSPHPEKLKEKKNVDEDCGLKKGNISFFISTHTLAEGRVSQDNVRLPNKATVV